MKILRVQAGVYAVNCYIIYSETTKDGIIVDPGGDVDDLVKNIAENNITLKYIVLTHGHGDHIGGVQELKDKFNIPVLIHKDDSELIEDASKNLSIEMPMGAVELNAETLLNDGDIIEFGDIKVEVIHTPGHTKGGICLKANGHLISGDTLFKGSIGRSDLLGGNHQTLIESIKEKLLILQDDTIVLPGHGQPTTIGSEKAFNPYLK